MHVLVPRLESATQTRRADQAKSRHSSLHSLPKPWIRRTMVRSQVDSVMACHASCPPSGSVFPELPQSSRHDMDATAHA
ncbi:uncharacterized protein UV8b_05939 [Ustilaginoidea virens]|uniref:Uncharacterized protein n=1 Tax=Ustilaginoidea virens TaxID=1159556 RepID=A0A8E5MJE1_USTVR|nr:uncharacterized protein UV8b_05939 [Ustilaginoidea virens]QUC21696.1 hypothetical protein UV8b_05939 [Ustilaginoidea virens]